MVCAAAPFAIAAAEAVDAGSSEVVVTNAAGAATRATAIAILHSPA